MLKIKTRELSRPLLPADPYEEGPHSPFSQHLQGGHPVDLEVNHYLELRSNILVYTFDDALHFWRDRESEFANLSKLAKRCLCITSSAACERIFSILGRTVSTDRQSLKPETVRILIKLKEMERFKQIYP